MLFQVKPFDYEHSEMLLYQNIVMIEAGMYVESLEYMDRHKEEIVDVLYVHETKGELKNHLVSWACII